MTRFLTAAVAAVSLLAGCNQADNGRVQGYVEGEFVYVASPHAGALRKLHVARGDQAHVGDPLFALDDEPEKTARDESARKAAQARATLEDLKKGKRPTEIEAVEAQLRQARAALVLSEKELARQMELFRTRSASAEDVERARAARDQDGQRVAQFEADLKTARLPAREDQIAAAEASFRAAESALAKAEWDLAQKRQAAGQAGLVFDTLYREGEWVAAGKPVVVLLPPPNIKVRAFVPQARVGALRPGQAVRVFVDGVAQPLAGKVTYISPRAEFTPPVIYSRESRDKLVFMVEASFDDPTAAKLHPGQPVDVEFGP